MTARGGRDVLVRLDMAAVQDRPPNATGGGLQAPSGGGVVQYGFKIALLHFERCREGVVIIMYLYFFEETQTAVAAAALRRR